MKARRQRASERGNIYCRAVRRPTSLFLSLLIANNRLIDKPERRPSNSDDVNYFELDDFEGNLEMTFRQRCSVTFRNV